MRTISIRAFAYAVHAVTWFVVFATVAAELSPAFKNMLANGFGHHWLAKSDIAVILFIAVALVFSRKQDPEDVTGVIKGVLVSVLLGALAIFGFYLGHYLGLF